MTAAERAAEVIERLFFNGLPDTGLESALAITDALMSDPDLLRAMAAEADPDLLVDLAIEAGGLEQVNYVGGVVETVVLDEALYRRTPEVDR